MSHPPPDATAEDVRLASVRLAPWVHRTPVFTSRTLDGRCGGHVFVKCENFQRAGAFKFRGAMNAVLQLSAERRRAGVVTHSSGNHGQALALAGHLIGVPVTVVMPRSAPAVKREATEGYGATIVPCESTLAAREAAVADLVARHGFEVVPPYDDWRVIAGQGTAARELLEQAPNLDAVLCPTGGGGLLAGTALAVKGHAPPGLVFGVEPANADDARRSLAADRILPANDPDTIADGLRASLGTRGFSVIRRDVDGILTATESEILDAMRLLWERLKLVVEPSGAVPIAALLNGQFKAHGLRVGVILSGGNVDLEAYFQRISPRRA